MNPLRHYPILSSLLRPFRLSQQKTCAVLVAALCQCAQASSFAIAGQVSCLTQVQFGSALLASTASCAIRDLITGA
jgi:hypothetical protein